MLKKTKLVCPRGMGKSGWAAEEVVARYFKELDYNIDPATVDWEHVSSNLFYCVWKRNNYCNDDATGATWFLQKTGDTLYLILEETRGRHSKDWNCNLDYYQ